MAQQPDLEMRFDGEPEGNLQPAHYFMACARTSPWRVARNRVDGGGVIRLH